MRPHAWGVFLVGSFALIALALPFGESVLGGTSLVLGVAAGITFFRSARRTPHPDPVPFVLWGAGLITLMAGVILREVIAGFGIVAAPNVADVVDLSGYAFLIASTLRMVRRRSYGLDPTNLLDSLIVTAATTVGMFPTVILPVLRLNEFPVADRAVEALFLTAALIFFGSLARLVLAPGVKNKSYYLLGIASGLAVANEISIAVGLPREGSLAANALTPLVISAIAFGCMGAAALHPGAVEITRRATAPVAHITIPRVVMMCISTLVAPLLLLWDHSLETSRYDTRVVTLGWIIVTALVVSRIAGIARAWQKAQYNERVVSRAAARLASSTDDSQMADAVFDAVKLLLDGGSTRTSYIRLLGDTATTVRTEGWLASSVGATASIDAFINVDDELSQSAEWVLSRPPDTTDATPTWWTGAPMISRGLVLGYLVTAAPKPLDPSYPESLASLANDFGSALHTASLTEEMHRAQVERRFRSLIENSDDVLIVVNASGTASFASPATTRILGYTESALTTVPVTRLATAAHRDQLARLLRAPGAKAAPLELQLEDVDGTCHWFEVIVSDLRHDPEIDGVVLTGREIDDRKAAEMRLAESEARFRGLVQHSSDVLAVVDRQGFVTYVSSSVRRVLHQQPHQVVGRELRSLVHPADHSSLTGLLYRLSTDSATPHGAELRMADGEFGWRTLDVTLTDLTSEPAVNGIVLNAHDVTERRNLENDLRHQALHDALTGLPNRVLFRDRVQQGIDLDREGSVAVLVLDIDDFKTINDAVGHDLGDEVLRAIATRLEGHLRAADTLCRLGGDEFAVLLRGAEDRERILQVTKRLLEEIRRPLDAQSRTFALDASLGLVFSADCPDVMPEILMRNADMALHKAKSSGKGRFVVYDEQMHSGVLERLALKNDLARAVDERQLILAFQPIVSLRTTRITGFEALMRWRHPERGMVSPGSFIPLAEETGLIVPMGLWLLETAFAQLATWRTQHDVTMSVNLSPRQLESAAIVDDIAEHLKRHMLDPSVVTMELTESEAVERGSVFHRRLEAIRDLGVRVVADDFGSGYASYAALGELPYTGVKIDMSIVQALGGENTRRAEAQIRSMCEMAASMGLSVVAEGVEGGEQAAALIALGCDLAQGYYFSPPVPPADAEKLMSQRVVTARR